MTAPALATIQDFEPAERRILERVPAEVFRKDDAYEVRAGDSRVDGLDQWAAYVLRNSHNRSLTDQWFAESLREGTDDAPWSDSWLTADEARAACTASSGGVA